MKDACHYVKVYCDCLLEHHLNCEMAYQGPHIFGKLMDHLGELPNGSGFFHDLISIKIDKMRKLHPDFNLSVVLLSNLKAKQYKAVCAWEILSGKKPEGAEKVLLSGKDIAKYLMVDYDCLKKSRQRAIDRINAELGVLIA